MVASLLTDFCIASAAAVVAATVTLLPYVMLLFVVTAVVAVGTVDVALFRFAFV